MVLVIFSAMSVVVPLLLPLFGFWLCFGYGESIILKGSDLFLLECSHCLFSFQWWVWIRFIVLNLGVFFFSLIIGSWFSLLIVESLSLTAFFSESSLLSLFSWLSWSSVLSWSFVVSVSIFASSSVVSSWFLFCAFSWLLRTSVLDYFLFCWNLLSNNRLLMFNFRLRNFLFNFGNNWLFNNWLRLDLLNLNL